ncbi:HIRAN domain-containing protein [Variovorax sp. dw_308]|uniref:HIRAN domain-containing protein n=1 Tax=Variovorax sp. dw_308 TaxID=2721546 RepID=UPI001C4766AD|nr:HIRAN domain-containing protein [Variovorax sp. dw_308]
MTIAGTSHYRGAIAAIAQNPINTHALVICLGYLVPDDQNPHDPNAVRVVIEGQTVGHLSASFAQTYRSYLSHLPERIEHVSVAAVITNGLRTKDRAYEYTIEIDFPDDLGIGILTEPMEHEIIRVNGYSALQPDADGSYSAKVWVPTGDFDELHKSRAVEEWTTDAWETVNFYACNRQNIGLGLKVYELTKAEYAALFKDGPTTGVLVLRKNRFATLRLTPAT